VAKKAAPKPVAEKAAAKPVADKVATESTEKLQMPKPSGRPLTEGGSKK
jgi:hypothetical protein